MLVCTWERTDAPDHSATMNAKGACYPNCVYLRGIPTSHKCLYVHLSKYQTHRGFGPNTSLK